MFQIFLFFSCSPTIRIFHRHLGPNWYIFAVKVSPTFYGDFMTYHCHFNAKKHRPKWFRVKNLCIMYIRTSWYYVYIDWPINRSLILYTIIFNKRINCSLPWQVFEIFKWIDTNTNRFTVTRFDSCFRSIDLEQAVWYMSLLDWYFTMKLLLACPLTMQH